MIVSRERDIDNAAAAAKCVVDTHFALVDYVKPGLTLAEIDEEVGRILKSLHCRSAFRKYKLAGLPPFPSHSCLSVNECIVHGTHHMRLEPLVPGDMISIDIGVKHNGWIGDAAWTYAIQEVSDENLALMRTGRESLARGVEAMQPGRPLLDWARAVQTYVEDECKMQLIRGLGGHGYGTTLHGPPFISNVVPRHGAEWPDAFKTFDPGMLLAVEPMISPTTATITSERNSWPIYSDDGSMSVHYEADVLITSDGPRDLTKGMRELPDIVGN